MKVEQIDKNTLRSCEDRELHSLRQRTIQLYDKYFDGNFHKKVGPIDREAFLNGHRTLMQEMHTRRLSYLTKAIDREAFKQAMLGVNIPALGEALLVSDFVVLTGEIVSSPKTAKTIEVVVKTSETSLLKEWKKTIIDVIKKHNDQPISFVFSPEGSKQECIPVFDLLLRAKSVTVKQQAAKAEVKDPHQEMDEWTDALMEEHLAVSKLLEEGDRILDLGCGTGRSMKAWQTDFEVEGVDKDLVALKCCGDKKLKVSRLDLDEESELPYEDGSYSVVHIARVLSLLRRPTEILQEAKRIAKKKVIVVETGDDVNKFRELVGKTERVKLKGKTKSTLIFELKCDVKTKKSVGTSEERVNETSSLLDIRQWLDRCQTVVLEKGVKGIRCVCGKRNGVVQLNIRDGTILLDNLDSLVEIVKQIPEDFMIEGSLQIVRKGKFLSCLPSNSRVWKTDKISFIYSDLLEYQNQLLTEVPYSERQELLKKILPPSTGLILPSTTQILSTAELLLPEKILREINLSGKEACLLKNAEAGALPEESILFKSVFPFEINEQGTGSLQLRITDISQVQQEQIKKIKDGYIEASNNPRKLRMFLKGLLGDRSAIFQFNFVKDLETRIGCLEIEKLSGLIKLDKLATDLLPFQWQGSSEEHEIELNLDMGNFRWALIEDQTMCKRLEIKDLQLFPDGFYEICSEEDQRQWFFMKIEGEGEGEFVFERPLSIVAIRKDKEERIVYGIVYEPDTVDTQGDMATADEIRKAAYQFMEQAQKFKVNHEGKPIKARVLESYIAPADLTIEGQPVKKGSWIMATRILDKDVWEEIKSGTLTGFSMAGYANRTILA